MHYSKFVDTVNNLKMCDRHVVMSDLIEDYYKSLPNVCKSFIGGDFKNATSIEDIQRKAEQASAFMHVTSTPKQDGSLPKPITVHAMPTSPSSTPPSPRQRNRRNQNQPVKIRQCYHCGSTNIGLALIVPSSLNLRPMQGKLCGRSAMMRKVLATNTTNSTLSACREIFKHNESVDDETPRSNRLDNVSLRLAVTQLALLLLKRKFRLTVVHNSCEEVGRRRSYLRRPLNSRQLKRRGLMSARRHQPVKEHESLSLKDTHRTVSECTRRR
jgi:hypothetical protein